MAFPHPRLPGVLDRRVDRRVMLKASAAFGAMAAVGGVVRRPARAQESATRAATWSEPQNVGAFAAAAEGQIIPADFTFYAAAPHWNGDIGFTGLVEMSFSADGESWLDPITVGEANVDAGQPDRDGRRFGQLALVDGANYIRYRTTDTEGNPSALGGLAFTYIDASSGPSMDDVFSAALTPSVDPPPIITREMWGADERYRHVDQDFDEPIQWPPDYLPVEHVIIHHTVTPNFQDPLIAIRSIYYYHAVTRGWSDIGYNYLVDFMGNVYEGRFGGENVIGGHSYQYARGSSGIGTMGNFTSVDETPEMQAGVIWITSWVGRNLDPFGSGPFHEQDDLPTICGHRDVNDTECPGDALYSNLDWIRASVANVLTGAIDPEPNPAFTEGDVVRISVDAANLRSGPGTNYRVITVVPFNTVLRIVDGPTTNRGYTWYQVSGSQGTGWCAAELLELTDAAPPPPPVAEFGVGDFVVVDTDALNLREGPGIDYDVVVVAPNGTQAEIEEGPSPANGYNWFKLNTSIGTGWGVGVYLALSDNPPAVDGPFAVGADVVVDTDALNLRTGPSTGQGISAVMPTGAQLTIIGGPTEAGGYLWYEVSSSVYGDGWCVAEYLAAAGGPPAGVGRFSTGDDVVVDTDALNLRSGPGTNRSVVAVMPTGTPLTITDGPRSADNFTWYRVSSATYGNGWCVEQFLAAAGGSSGGGSVFSNDDMVFVDTDALNLRSDARSDASVRATMPTGTRLRITGGPRSRDGYSWFRVDSSTYGSGWCAGEFLSLVSASTANGIEDGDTVRVIDGALNMRSAAGTDNDVIAVVPDGARLTITAGPRSSDGYTWYRVRSSTYGEGWSAAEFLEPV